MFRRRPKRPTGGVMLDAVGSAVENNTQMEHSMAPLLKSFKKLAESQKAVEAAEQKYSLLIEQSGAADIGPGPARTSEGQGEAAEGDTAGPTTAGPMQKFVAASDRLHDLSFIQPGLTQSFMIDPLKSFGRIFGATSDAISSQKRGAVTARKARDKVEKLRSKGAAVDAEKLSKALRQKEETEVQDRDHLELVVKDVPAVYTLRTEFIAPCVLATVSANIYHFEQACDTIGAEDADLLQLAQDPADYEAETKRLLAGMRNISIVGSA